ncbi:PREDICTED: uncharacterized protein LOC101812773 [Ficedula albicollis]|uniref:uncharacterized protein LOC101812773 n=1 Tax=Ficedula albicollis TaxID=59894 RepID=UPI000359370A|nr:PREDICTED: uncharacterized protein LOC101812773 [Ficedula albicollis]
MPGSGSRGFRKMHSQQPRMEGTAAEAARGSGSPSQDPPSPAQRRGNTNTEVEDHCPICLDSWREPSFVMPCLHCFCYACIRRWAKTKTQCPLCKGKMTSILHSVRADDDFKEVFIIPRATPPEVPPAGNAHREPDAPNLPRPEAHQQWVAEGDGQHFLGGFYLPNWMRCFSAGSALQQTLHSWFRQSLEMLFETVTSRTQRTSVPEQQRCREHHHCPCQRDTRGTTGQEGSSSSPTPAPARSSADEMPSTSSSAIGWGPSTHPSASTTTHVEQQPQEEQERLRPGLPSFFRRGDPSLRGPQRPRKRRASSPKGFPPHRRPRY